MSYRVILLFSLFFCVNSTAEAIRIDVGGPADGTFNSLFTGGNWSTPYAAFADVDSEVGVHQPENWFANNFPYIDYLRFGNFLYGHCNVPDWADNRNLREMIEWNGSTYISDFGQLEEYIDNVVRSGTTPHITLTGTPLHLHDKNINLNTYNEKIDNGICGSFSHVSEPPASSNIFDWQFMVGDLLDNFAQIYGWSEVDDWRWTTWTEPDGAGHFTGSSSDARDLIRMSRNIFEWHEDIENRNMDFRLGNFINPEDSGETSDIANIIHGLQGENVDIWDEMPGVGLSVYQGPGKDFDSIVDGLDRFYSVLDDATPRLINLPVYLDEAGLLGVNKNGKGWGGYKDDPTMYGASWWARLYKTVLDHTLNISAIYAWQYNWYLDRRTFQDLSNRVKLPSLSTVHMLEQLSGQTRISDTACSTGGCLDYLASRSSSDDRYNALIFRHVTDYDDSSVYSDEVCFDGLTANQEYFLALNTIGEGGLTAFEEVLTYGNKPDYRDYCGADRGSCDLNTVLDAVPAAAVSGLQRLDDIVLQESQLLRPSGGSICTTVNTSAHDIQWLHLAKVEDNASATSLELHFDHSVVSSEGAAPSIATKLSFDRGMDLPANSSFVDPADSGGAWDNYKNDRSGPSSYGSESEHGLYASSGDNLTYENREINFENGSIKLWVKPDWSYQPGASARKSLLSWRYQPWSNDVQLYVWNQQNLSLFVHVDGVRYSAYYPITDWVENEWHHIEAKIGQQEIELIVDGISRDTTVINSTAFNRMDGVAADLVIGGNGNNNWDGVIDHLIMK